MKSYPACIDNPKKQIPFNGYFQYVCFITLIDIETIVRCIYYLINSILLISRLFI